MALEFRNSFRTRAFWMSSFARSLAALIEDGTFQIDNPISSLAYIRNAARLMYRVSRAPDDFCTAAIDEKMRDCVLLFRKIDNPYSMVCSIRSAVRMFAENGTMYSQWAGPFKPLYEYMWERETYDYLGTVDDLWIPSKEDQVEVEAGPHPWCNVGSLYSIEYHSATLHLAMETLSPELYPWQMLVDAEAQSAENVALPWSEHLEPIAGHYARLSTKFPGKVSFYQSEDHAKAGRRTAIKPGRYLTRYYPDMSPAAVREWASKADNFTELQFAETADEIERVYTSGPSSCMSYSESHFDSPIHPVRVYAGPDLKVAYLNGSGGRISARCLVWPEKKVHGRIYGDEIRMQQALEAAGYSTHQGHGCGLFDGARLTLHRCKYEKKIVLPYIDGSDVCHISDGYVVIGSGDGSDEYICKNTNGWGEQEEQVYIVDRDEYVSLEWAEDNTTYCEHHDEWNESVTEVVVRIIRGREYHSYVGDQYDTFEYGGETYLTDSIPFTSVDDIGGDVVIMPDHYLDRDAVYLADEDRYVTHDLAYEIEAEKEAENDEEDLQEAA